VTSLELALANVAAWSLQAGALVIAAAALERALPVERPRVRLALVQGLLALVVALPLLQPWQVTSTSVSWSAAESLAGPAGAPLDPAVEPSAATEPWWVAAALLLAAGAALRLARFARALVELHALGRGARPLAPPPWLAALRDEVAPRARFAVADSACVPATFGLRRPLVLLPPDFESRGRESQAQLALHELLHARRRDWLALLVEELLAIAAWFHPGVLWLVARARLAREQCVDAAVVARLGGRQGYLESLVEAARARSSERAVPAAPFSGESHLRERVDLLLKEVPMSATRTICNLSLSAAGLVLALALTASAVPLQSNAPSAAATAETDPIRPPSEPKKVHHVSPVYPPNAKADKAQGAVEVSLIVGKDGSVRDAKAAASAASVDRLGQLAPKKGTPEALEGDPRLAEAAVAAVKQWRYEPFQVNGKPVDVKMTVTIHFRL
jgi:beta-lactamase regulating signal transducer with metallopeptidase domain